MVNVLVSISDRANRVLGIVKAKYGMKSKSQAVQHVIEEYEQDVLEPELRPEYIEKLQKLLKEKHKAIPVQNFRKRYGLD